MEEAPVPNVVLETSQGAVVTGADGRAFGSGLGDGLLTSVPDLHAAPRTFLPHRYNNKSSRDVYGGMWADYTVLILRHQKVH